MLCCVKLSQNLKKGENMLVSMDVVEETAPGEIGSAVNEKC